MAFFPRNLYHSGGSFTPLFRLLEDFDTYSSNRASDRGASIHSWQPKFDVAENTDAFELHGELPGIRKEDVHIEFTEPQTVTIRGKSERTYTEGEPPAGLLESDAKGGVITEAGETAKDNDQSKPQEVEKTIKNQEPKTRLWLSERSIGEFSRSFNFPTPVDQGAVTANFKDGILSLRIPKAKRYSTKRVTIQ